MLRKSLRPLFVLVPSAILLIWELDIGSKIHDENSFHAFLFVGSMVSIFISLIWSIVVLGDIIDDKREATELTNWIWDGSSVLRKEIRAYFLNRLYENFSFDPMQEFGIARAGSYTTVVREINERLSFLAKDFLEACRNQEATRKSIKNTSEFTLEVASELYRVLGENDKKVAETKRRLWRLHELAKKFRIGVLPEAEAYTKLKFS